jgi:hypothetical protein
MVYWCMAVGSLPELFEVPAADDRSAVLGTMEGPWLDFRSQAYKLDTPRGIADMVSAEVAAFANGTSHGVLLLARRRAPRCSNGIGQSHDWQVP